MDNLLRAKIIVELLDDTKYPILSSLTPSEISKLDKIKLEDINDLSNIQINSILNEFIQLVQASESKATEDATESNNETQEKSADKSESIETEKNDDNAVEDPSNKEEANTVEDPDSKEEDNTILQDQDESSLDDMANKIQSQPSQVIACIIAKLDDTKKAHVLSNISDDKKQDVLSIDVENLPISDEVINLIIKELEIA